MADEPFSDTAESKTEEVPEGQALVSWHLVQAVLAFKLQEFQYLKISNANGMPMDLNEDRT